MKTGMPLLVRMPEWVDTNQVTCTVNGALLWTGRYSSPGTVATGQIATFLFPIGERIVRQRIGAIDATLIFRGNTVVEITPKGKNCPLIRGNAVDLSWCGKLSPVLNPLVWRAFCYARLIWA